MPKMNVNDISMYYEIHGEGEPLVLISGFSVDHVAWRNVIDLFKPHYKVILLDNRGAGQTDVPTGDYSIEQMANDVAALCKQLDIKQAHFVGNSMGGFIVQRLAYQYPQLIKSLTISNSATNGRTCFSIYLSALEELLNAGAPIASLMKVSLSWIYSHQFLTQPGMIDALIQLGLNNPYPFTMPGFLGQRAALNQFDSSSWVGQINAPTLVIGGNQDLVFSEPSVQHLAKSIPGATYHGFNNCGHLPFMEYPEQFAEIIKKHINAHRLNSILS